MKEIPLYTKELLQKVFSCICDFWVVAFIYIHYSEKTAFSEGVTVIPAFVFAVCLIHGLTCLINIILSNEFLVLPVKIAKFSVSIITICAASGHIFYDRNTLLYAAFLILIASFIIFDTRPRLSFLQTIIALVPSFIAAAFCFAEYCGIYDFIFISISEMNFSQAISFLCTSFFSAIIIYILNGRRLNPIFSFLRLVIKK